MAFLYPLALYGLFFNLIPIIIHLMNLQRSKKVLFSNVQFLSTIQKKTSRSYQLRRWLVLLSRICFITFLVLVFAKPVILKKESPLVPVSKRMIYLDNSNSMESVIGERNLLDMGVAAVETLLQSGRESDDVLLQTDSRRAVSRFQKGKDVLDILPTLHYANGSQSLSSVLNTAYSIRQRQLEPNTPVELFLISDFQKHNVNLQESSSAIDSSTKINLIPLKSDPVANLFVDSLWFDVPFISKGEQALVHVKVSNGGTVPAKEVMLRLFLSDIQKSSVTVSLEPGQSRVINMNFIADESGLQRGKIQLDDYPVVFDNDFFFTFYVSANVNVATITEPNEEPYVSKAFSHEAMFTHRGFTSNAVSYDAVQFSDLLVIQNAPLADESSKSMITNKLKDGQHVLLFPSALSNPKDLVDIFRAADLQDLRVERFSSADSSLIKMKAPNQRHPFFANVFENFDSKMSTPLIRPIFKITGAMDEILATVTGLPALVKMENSQGGVLYVCTAPLTNSHSTFQKHSLFIPVLYRIAMESASGNDRLYTRINQSATISIDSLGVNQTYQLKSTDVELVPDQSIQSGKLVLSVTDNALGAGFYDITANGVKHSTLAINVAKKESQLEVITPEDLIQQFAQFPDVQILEIDDDKSLESVSGYSNKNIPLWKYSLILSLMFLLIETAFIRFLK